MENKKIFSFNGKNYKTEAAMKKAKTMDAKRKIKEVKQEAYTKSDKKIKREKTIFTNKLNSIILKKSEQANSRTYHITGMIQQAVHYKNKYSKEEGYKKDQLIRDSQVIQAKNLSLARQKFTDTAVQKFSRNTNGKDSPEDIEESVENIEFIDEVEETALQPSKPSTMFMKAASPMNYTWTTEERKYLKFDGHCVEDNLIGVYGPLIKKFTKIKIIELATEYYNDKNWTPERGYTPKCIMYICKYFNICMYAYDIMNTCFLKYIIPHEKKNNYPVLYYYAINNHMYLVKDPSTCKSLTEKAKDTHSFNTSLVEKDKASNPFIELPIYENIDITTLKGYDSCVVIYNRYSKNDINDIFEQCLGLYGIPISKSIQANKSQITRFEYKLDDKIYIICHDPNDDNFNWAIIKKLCEKHYVEFRNQTFPAFITEFKNNLINKPVERPDHKKEDRQAILKRFNSICNDCKEKIDDRFEIDHIKPIAQGGTNYDDNLQVLCRSCHKKKTQTEQEDGSYIKIIDTESSFNNQVQTLMDSDLSFRYAFIEHIKPLPLEEEVRIPTNSNLMRAKAAYKRELIALKKNMSDKEIDAFIDSCDFSLYEEKPLKTQKPQLKIFNIDINKCRRNNLYYSKYNLPTFCVMDSIKEYNNKLVDGFYYVETDQYFPMRGNGLYSRPMIETCLKDKLITHDNIKYVVQSTLTIPPSYYNEFIDLCQASLIKDDELIELYKKYGINHDNIDLKKLGPNVMIGRFKPNLNKNVQWKSVCITSSTCEAYEQFLQNKGCFIEVIKINDVKYFHVYKEIFKTNIETEKPIYDQILDLEAIALYELSKLIKSKGGEVLDLNTDCISCSFPNDVLPFELDGKNIKGYYFDDVNKVPKYKLEDKNTRLQVERMPNYSRSNKYEFDKKTWNIYNDVEDNNFKPLVDQVINLNKSLFITGPAGTGKSQLIRDIKTDLETQGKNYICLAPTNLAALNIKGTTIHKFVSKLRKMDSLYTLELDYIFVDEISMVKEIFYKFFLMLKRIKPNLKFIIAGDFNQLKPVNDRIGSRFDYSNSQALLELCDFNKLQLSICRRSDDVLFNMCKFENIMNIDKSVFESVYTERHLSFTNKRRIEVNDNCMNIRAKKYHKKITFLAANKHDPDSQDVKLMPLVPVICKANDKEMELINNEQFTISKIDDNFIYMKNLERSIKIPISKFQKLFYVAYCITTHKSQGSSFNFPYTIHEWDRFDKHLRYVALTRSTDIKYINII